MKVKYLGGVTVRTIFGLVNPGEEIEIPKSIVEELSPIEWKPVSKKEAKS